MIKVHYEPHGEEAPLFFDNSTSLGEIKLFLIERLNRVAAVADHQPKIIQLREAASSSTDLFNPYFYDEPTCERYILDYDYFDLTVNARIKHKFAVVIKKVEDPIKIRVKKYLTNACPTIRDIAKKLIEK